MSPPAPRGDTIDRPPGFALILAVLALGLLTMLGLAVAMSTSVELQIATNARWQHQAQYNAESGVEVGRLLLRDMSWTMVLPPARAPWDPEGTLPPLPAAPYENARNFEGGECDRYGGGVGRGLVLHDGSGDAPYQDVASILGRSLPGAFTLWVRRVRLAAGDGSGNYVDEPTGDVLILTSEGVAPYQDPGSALARRHHAVRTVEARVRRRPAAVGWDVSMERLYPLQAICP